MSDRLITLAFATAGLVLAPACDIHVDGDTAAQGLSATADETGNSAAGTTTSQSPPEGTTPVDSAASEQSTGGEHHDPLPEDPDDATGTTAAQPIPPSDGDTSGGDWAGSDSSGDGGFGSTGGHFCEFLGEQGCGLLPQLCVWDPALGCAGV